MDFELRGRRRRLYLGLGEAAAVRRGRGRGHWVDPTVAVAARARRGRQRPGLAEGREGRRLVQHEVGDMVEEGGGVVRQVGQVEQWRRLDAFRWIESIVVCNWMGRENLQWWLCLRATMQAPPLFLNRLRA